MKFKKQDYTQKVAKLEKLLEHDFGILTQCIRGGGNQITNLAQRQKLIEQLQYHDIIRQKIQHVGEFAEVMEVEASKITASAQEVSLLPGMLELAMAMLQFAGLEYEEIREEIILQLQELGNSDQREIYEQFRLEMGELIKSLSTIYLLVDGTEDLQNLKISAEKLKEVCKSFSMETEREIFRTLFNDDGCSQNTSVQDIATNSSIELF